MFFEQLQRNAVVICFATQRIAKLVVMVVARHDEITGVPRLKAGPNLVCMMRFDHRLSVLGRTPHNCLVARARVAIWRQGIPDSARHSGFVLDLFVRSVRCRCSCDERSF